MTNGAPKNPETLEEFIKVKNQGFETGTTKRKATEIVNAATTIDNQLAIAEEFHRNTGTAEEGILKILEDEFELDRTDYETRRQANTENLHKELIDHTYRAYHAFLSSIAAIIDNLEGENIDKAKIAAAIIKYCKQQPENSIFHWMAESERARGAIKTMVDSGVNKTDRAELIEAIQHARTESTNAFKDFTEDKIDPLLRTIGLLKETKGTKRDLKEKVEKELKDVPPREKVLEIFNDYTKLIELEGKDRGLEIRTNGKRIELQPNDLAIVDTTKMQEIAALYASGARIVFVAYLTKAPAQ